MKSIKQLIFGYFLICVTLVSAQNVYVNKEWETEIGFPLLQSSWQHSLLNQGNQLVNVGNTQVLGQGADILITLIDADGAILWNTTFNTNGASNDFGITLNFDTFGNLWVCGFTDNLGTNNQDIILLKLDMNGNILNSYQYDSPFGGNDIPIAITTDVQGNVYIAANSIGNATLNDYLLLAFDNNGSFLWESRYDYNNYEDIVTAMSWDSNGNILLSGGSGVSQNDWDYTLLQYDTQGNLVSEKRDSTLTMGLDQITALAKDGLGNIYVTGKSYNGLNYDIKTLKLSANLSVSWTQIFDALGEDDAANAICVDKEGSSIVTGYRTNILGVKEILLVKYDSAGNVVWTYTQNGKMETADAYARDVKVDSLNRIYAIIQEKGRWGTADVGVIVLDSNGEKLWEEKIATENQDFSAEIQMNETGDVWLSSRKENIQNNSYRIVKYRHKGKPTESIYNGNDYPICSGREIIVCFDSSAVNRTAIDNYGDGREINYAAANYFLKANAANAIQQKLAHFVLPNTAYTPVLTKVFPYLKTTELTTISRLGEAIPIPPFWATFLLEIPNGANVFEVCDSLNTLIPTLHFANPDWYVSLASGANDSLYSEQASLHNTTSFSDNVGISVESAWDIETGKPFIKVGVFDSGLQWTHPDFGYDGVNPSTSRVVDGWNFITNTPLKSNITADGHKAHGTSVAGIIGAIRNNSMGVAGIAGGDGNNKGVSLYGMRATTADTWNTSSGISIMANALVESAMEDTTKDYRYGIHLNNDSWVLSDAANDANFTPSNVVLLRNAFHFLHRMKVTSVVSRGNIGIDDESYPSLFPDDWKICVTATGNDGKFCSNGNNCTYTSCFGRGVDMAAPGHEDIIHTTGYPGYIYQGVDETYRAFNGTSAAAPHVTGIAALLMSYLNDSFPSYNNLAPEDVENILQLTAVDDSVILGVDSLMGYGRVNAGKALKRVEKPYNKIQHFGTNPLSNYDIQIDSIAFLPSATLDWEYQANTTGVVYPTGIYDVTAYKVKAKVYHNLPLSDSIVSYWGRSSSSNTFRKYFNSLLGPHVFAIEGLKIDSLDHFSAVVSGYVYHLSSSTLGISGWMPMDTTLDSLRLEYSILTSDMNMTSLNSFHTPNYIDCFLYPNPSQEIQHLAVKTTRGNINIVIRLFDMLGRSIDIQPKVVEHSANEQKFEININHLAKGVYYYTLSNGNQTQTIRFIKY